MANINRFLKGQGFDSQQDFSLVASVESQQLGVAFDGGCDKDSVIFCNGQLPEQLVESNSVGSL